MHRYTSKYGFGFTCGAHFCLWANTGLVYWQEACDFSVTWIDTVLLVCSISLVPNRDFCCSNLCLFYVHSTFKFFYYHCYVRSCTNFTWGWLSFFLILIRFYPAMWLITFGAQNLPEEGLRGYLLCSWHYNKVINWLSSNLSPNLYFYIIHWSFYKNNVLLCTQCITSVKLREF